MHDRGGEVGLVGDGVVVDGRQTLLVQVYCPDDPHTQRLQSTVVA